VANIALGFPALLVQIFARLEELLIPQIFLMGYVNVQCFAAFHTGGT
jgi:hypothetical protein